VSPPTAASAAHVGVVPELLRGAVALTPREGPRRRAARRRIAADGPVECAALSVPVSMMRDGADAWWRSNVVAVVVAGVKAMVVTVVKMLAIRNRSGGDGL